MTWWITIGRPYEFFRSFSHYLFIICFYLFYSYFLFIFHFILYETFIRISQTFHNNIVAEVVQDT